MISSCKKTNLFLKKHIPEVNFKILHSTGYHKNYNKSKAEYGRSPRYEMAISMLRVAIETIEDGRLRVVCYGH